MDLAGSSSVSAMSRSAPTIWSVVQAGGELGELVNEQSQAEEERFAEAPSRSNSGAREEGKRMSSRSSLGARKEREAVGEEQLRRHRRGGGEAANECRGVGGHAGGHWTGTYKCVRFSSPRSDLAPLSPTCGHGRSTPHHHHHSSSSLPPLLLKPHRHPSRLPPSVPTPLSMAAITTTATAAAAASSSFLRRRPGARPLATAGSLRACPGHCHHRYRLSCRATEVSGAETSAAPPAETTGGGGGASWVPVVPLAALPRGERRVIVQDGEEILLLWYKDQVFAIENRSPAEGAYTEGLLNAKLTQDGCIVCPSTDSTFDLRTGEIKEWYPKNPVLRALTPALRKLFTYRVKTDEQNIYISISGADSVGSAEIIFSGKAQPGVTASDVNVQEVRMIVDEDVGGFGFTSANELINGKAAIIGFLLLIDFELLTGKGLLKGTGFLDFIYAVSGAFN
nr:unnamed protein product [Digitaria exilis]